MVRRKDERTLDIKKMFNGQGEAKMLRILNTNEEMYNKGRVFTQVTLEPGCEIGWHIHHGDGETYCILSGQGEYNDNGNIVPVSAGDVTFVDVEEGHALKNTGTEPLEAIALILYR